MPDKTPTQGQPPTDPNQSGTSTGAGAATGTGTGTGTSSGTAQGGAANNKGGTRPKDTKTTPPPSQFASPPPTQVLQLTPEMFRQTVAAAVTAALTASQQSAPPVATAAAAAAVAAPATASSVVPRKEKKLAEFWTSRPTMWFRLFDGQYPASMTQDFRFDALLNHLPSSSLPFVDHILRTPGTDPFTRARACLIKHYEVSPRDRARTLRSLTSLGDKTPTEMLYYMRSLLPGCPDNALFEAIFIDLLPPNARDAAVKHELLEDMAEAADQVLAEAPAAPNVNSASYDFDGTPMIAPAARSSPAAASTQKTPTKDPSLCYIHNRYGRGAYKCAAPRNCRMRDVIAKQDAPASGNGPAGRQ